MSDLEESGVTYTDISSPFEELSDIGSPRADDHEYLMMLEDPYVPPSPDYIPGPEHADDEIVAEDQPYAEDASPIAQSPEYVPADGGDDDDDEEESSEDEEDDEMDVEADEEEEEHPAPADSVVVAPTAVDQAPSVEETEPFETDKSAATSPPHPAYRTTARISIPALVPMPAWTDSEVVRLLAISSPPASPLSPWDSRAHAYTRQLMETEARMSREAWARATDASDLVHSKVISLRTTVLALQGQITALQGQVAALQAQVATLQGQQGLAGDPT
nr:hypothetical protein [Tanacetum cinerariifolium]